MIRSRLFLPTALILASLPALASTAAAQVARPAATAPVHHPLPERARAQMAAIAADKATWTPAQQKMSSQLIYAARFVKGEPAVAPAALPSILHRVGLQGASRVVTVDIRAAVDDALLAALRALGAQIVSAFPQYGAVRAQLPVVDVERVAALPAVRFVAPAAVPRFNSVHAAQLTAAAPVTNVIQQTQGDHAHAADVVRSMGITGTGIKVGVLSDGVDSLAAQETAGALPSVTVLPGQAGSGDEGTAMLEIVHTLAPNAQLFYATGNGGDAQMAANIAALRTAGCAVIIDDVTYFDEGLFQDSAIAQEVETATAGGALYFSSAQNSGNFDSSIAVGTWEGDYAASSTTVAGVGTYAEFKAFTSSAMSDHLTITGATEFILLKWSDALGASANDYDLYVTDTSGDVLASSTDTQNGTQDPIEFIDMGGSVSGVEIWVAKFSGSARALHVDTERGTTDINTPFATFGHNAAAGAVTVAAVPADEADGTGGVFQGGATEPVEYYSSDGPRRIFYQPNGTAITPGNFLIATNGGQVLSKPDLTAADCVSTNVGGEFSPFCGTSAAAPHAGAIAALALSMSSHPSAAQVKAAMLSSALSITASTAGAARDAGSGIVMANRTVAALSATPSAAKFFTVAPCRILDTRNAAGPLGGPALAANSTRGFVMTGVCGVPTTATAISVNVTITGAGAGGDLRLYNGDLSSPPLVSTINFRAGDTRANNAVLQLPASASGIIDVKSDVAASVQVIVDVNGYFQ